MGKYTVTKIITVIISVAVVRCEPQKQKDTSVSVSLDQPNGCQCSGYECSCCVKLNVAKIHLKETACVGAKYLPKEIGIELDLELNNKSLIREKVSLRNPPPLCVGIPHLHDYASLCVVLYNVTWSGKVGACLKIEAKLIGATIEDINVGCFHFNDQGFKFTKFLRNMLKWFLDNWKTPVHGKKTGIIL
ncbi:uncharacterized protein LOC130635820 [Hydractinia symbiolongicarpus]|uniref:uncharacterized protein LOC130635820 n=1 Tax=Hydractinia symbiolongicarpus TaxID=13093 RepID=UPI00254B5C54|nr:uncharacterized protein LOC130635820 [Hydractinia symbiolongicarpus]